MREKLNLTTSAATKLQTAAEMPKNFDFASSEPRIYDWWESNGWFKPESAAENAEPYTIAIPPPNVTGELHLGHAMFVSIEDLMIRLARMQGKAALWIPGTDHAGIATQLMVEKALKAEGTSRTEIGREKFNERAWAWKEKYGGAILDQFRRLGASADWDRLRFTLDETLSAAVREAFATLWEQGLLYRGPRLINWSPGLQTAVSDLEVERVEKTVQLYFFKYPIEGGEFIPVATTRPETILGDSAVAVHPEDERYRHLIGKMARVPMLDRLIPVIGDEYVAREFGTGALKVTPAHDFNDYELAKRHALPLINIMNKDASLNENAGSYAGLDRYAARKKLWADMEAQGLTIRTEDYATTIPVAQRGGETIEPLISEQWFVNMKPLAEKALDAVRSGQIKIVPERFEKIYFNWLENIEDWCISRQLWWGHRIPAYYDKDGKIYVSREGAPAGIDTTQDEDVLDTWFSSGLWPFSTLGWPSDTADLRRYYPTQMMETGYDILFFWVARMIMMGLWFTGKPPFSTVYLHGLILDEKGQKMSKTKGNVINPIAVMETYGTDAVRFTLITGGTPGNDQNLSEKKIEYGRNFGNKLWQMARFTITNLGTDYQPTPIDPGSLDLAGKWIISRLQSTIQSVYRLNESYQYGEAIRQVRDLLWDDMADWYIETAKDALYGTDEAARATTRDVLYHLVHHALRLLHPVMPFITEEIWSYLPGTDTALICARYPEANESFIDPVAETAFGTIRDVIIGIRNVRITFNVEPGKKIEALIGNGSGAQTVIDNPQVFARLCNVATIKLLGDQPVPDQASAIAAGDLTVYLPLAGMVDLSAERDRLNKELDAVRIQIEKTSGMLSNEGFTARAKPEIVAREREKLETLNATRAALESRLTELG